MSGYVSTGLVSLTAQMFDGVHMWSMGWMALWWIFVVVVAVALVWYLLSGRWRMSPRTESPVDILKGRYARGEIDKETYENMLQDLRK